MAEQDIPRLLSEADRAFVVAAAGCGKTEAVVRAVALSAGRRQLVLTHTHAGVNALRRRLQSMGVPKERYVVDTIAGWALRYAASYPQLSGLETPEPVGGQWANVYAAAGRALTTRAIRRVVVQSYGGIFVDEYQDCVRDQHTLVLQLAELLPCRVLGDPLQGIFDFGNQRVVDWATDVSPNFARLPDLVTPWRWRGHNEALGDWLGAVREPLSTGQPLDLATAPVAWVQSDTTAEWRSCIRFANGDGSIVAIRKWATNCHDLARTLRGTFTSMEEMDCADLLSAARELDTSTGPARALACIAFAKTCMTGLNNATSSLEATLRRGAVPRITARCAHPDLYLAAAAVAGDEDMRGIHALMLALRGHGEYLFRRELWDEMIRSLRAHARGSALSLRDAAWRARDITRRIGRREDRRTISRTLLVKGLEYDHAIVLKADELNAKNAYVALTRGRSSVTVIAPESTIRFPQPTNLLV